MEKILTQIPKDDISDESIKKALLKKHKKYHVKDSSKDFHTEFGIISKEELSKADGSVIATPKGKYFVINTPSFIDRYKKMQRSAQVIPLKDIGQIITTCGITRESIVVDAGAGSGGLCIMLAKYAKKVITYDIRDDHIEIVKKNKDALGIKNLSVKKKNIYEGINEKNVDVMTLDVPEPWKAISSINKSLRPGGFLVVYNPSIIQITDFVNELSKTNTFNVIKTIESIEREWEVSGRKVRPKTPKIGHSGFLCFCRRLRDV